MKLGREKWCTDTGAQKCQVWGDPAQLPGAASACTKPWQLHPEGL